MSDSARRVQVGAELRRIRESLDLSGVQVAAELAWSQSKVSRIEAGRLSIALNDLANLLALYGVTEEVRAELLTVAVAADGLPGAWIVRAGGPRRRQGEVAAIETRVRQIRQYAAMTIPGLLQCESYTRGIARAGGFPDVEDIVSRRRLRQTILTADQAPSYRVVVDERALQRWPGDESVRDDQLQRLSIATSLPSVDLRILPTGPTSGATALAQFLLYDFRDQDSGSVVMLEGQTADTYLSGPDDVRTYGELFDRLAAEALSAQDSGNYIRSLRDCVGSSTAGR